MSVEGETERRGKSRAKTYPLNSSRLMASIVARIAAALGLLKASLADSRQMIEGTLADDREPWSVQVDLVESEEGVAVDLRDAGGVFLQIPPSKLGDGDGDRESREASGEDGNGTKEDDGNGSGGGSLGADVVAREAESAEPEETEISGITAALDSAHARVVELERELEMANHRNTELDEEVRGLRDKLRKERDKYHTLWRMNCEQLLEYDKIIVSKEERIAALELQVAALEDGVATILVFYGGRCSVLH